MTSPPDHARPHDGLDRDGVYVEVLGELDVAARIAPAEVLARDHAINVVLGQARISDGSDRGLDSQAHAGAPRQCPSMLGFAEPGDGYLATEILQRVLASECRAATPSMLKTSTPK